VCLQPNPPRPRYIYPVPICCQKICPSRTYICRIGLKRHTTWGKWWICLNGTYALAEHGYVHQILKQLKSVTLGCEKVDVMNICMSVVSHCVVKYTNQVFWQKHGNEMAFFLVGCEENNRADRQARKFVNLTLLACRRHSIFEYFVWFGGCFYIC